MPNLSKIYTEACGIHIPGEVPLPTSPAEDATRMQLKSNWLESTVTQELIKALTEEVTNLETMARQMAVGYPSNQNHLAIIQYLVKADTIRKIIEKYARN